MNAMHLARWPRSAGWLIGTLVLSTCTLALAAPPSGIPERPDQLQFPPLQYAPPEAAQYRVNLAGGIPAYLAEDPTVPLVNVTVLLRIGPDLDPPGKEGLAETAVHLLTRSGTATMTAEQLEERLSFLGAELESGLGGGGGMMGFGRVPIGDSEARVTLNLLSKDIDAGLALLVDCLKQAGFQEDRLALRRDQEIQNMKRRNDESARIEQMEWGFLMYGPDHWSNRYATESSMKSIAREDLVAFQRRYVGPKNFVLAVSGDFEKRAMAKKLERAFAKWPTPGERPGPPAAPAASSSPGWFIADKDVNQTRVILGLRTIDRYDPDFYAAQVMNYILGGGGFTSRLVNRIRSDEGLAYTVRSSFDNGTYYAEPWRAFFQTKARSTAYALQIAFTEIGRVRDERVTESELETAKNALVEGFPARFPTAGAIAGVLAAEELTGRYAKDPKYLARFTSHVAEVTAEDVQRVARRLLDPAQMTVLMVGNATEMALPDGKHPVTLGELAGGDPQRLPARDPLTMKPVP